MLVSTFHLNVRWSFKFAVTAILSCGGSLILIADGAAQTHHAGTFQVQSLRAETDATTSDVATLKSAASFEAPAIDRLEYQEQSDSNLHSQPTQSTFTRQPLPTTPSAPQSILLPQSPSEHSFTQTADNTGVSGETVRMPGDGSQALGTFATENPYVRQAGEPGNQTLPPISQNGLRGSFGSTPTAHEQHTAPQPPIRPSVQTMSQSFGAQPQSNSAPRSFSQSQPAVRSFQSPTQSIGNGADNRTGNQTTHQPIGRSGFQATPVDRSISDNRSLQTRSLQTRSLQASGYSQPEDTYRVRTRPAKLLMERYSLDAATQALPGQPTTLLEMLQQPLSLAQRSEMVQQYWETYYDWANLQSRTEYVNWLNAVVAPSSPSDQALLTAAKSVASNRVLAAEIQLGKSQSRMMDFLPNRQNSLLPLPSDQPLIQKYKTNYELYRSHGMIPTRLRGIDEMLPKTLELISRRADTVTVAKSAADNARNSLASRQSTLASVMEASRIWRSAEQDLISTVTAYNQAIADYSLSITSVSGNQSPEQIVSMLIAKPKPADGITHRPSRSELGQSRHNLGQSRQIGQPANHRPELPGQSANSQFGSTFNSQLNTNAQPNARANPQHNFGNYSRPPERTANSNLNQFGR